MDKSAKVQGLLGAEWELTVVRSLGQGAGNSGEFKTRDRHMTRPVSRLGVSALALLPSLSKRRCLRSLEVPSAAGRHLARRQPP